MLPLLTQVGERNSQLLLLIYTLSVCGLFSHSDDTLHYENGKYYGGDLLHNLSMDTAQHFI